MSLSVRTASSQMDEEHVFIRYRNEREIKRGRERECLI